MKRQSQLLWPHRFDFQAAACSRDGGLGRVGTRHYISSIRASSCCWRPLQKRLLRSHLGNSWPHISLICVHATDAEERKTLLQLSGKKTGKKKCS